MATAQTASTSSSSSSSSRINPSPGSNAAARGGGSSASHARALGAMAASGSGDDGVRGTKRRMDEDERDRERDDGYASPAYSSVRNEKGPPASTYNARTPTFASPRTQLPSINSLSAGPHDETSAAKKRRAAGDATGYPDGTSARSPYPAYSREPYPAEDDGRYTSRRPAPLAAPPRRNGASASPGGPGGISPSLPAYSSQRSPSFYRGGEDSAGGPGGNGSYSDGNVPLARRRGDAAQAKANKLHIDVESASSDRTEYDVRPVVGNGGRELPAQHLSAQHHSHAHHQAQQHGAGNTLPPPRFALPPPPEGGLVARSAPPTRLHFAERGGEDPRVDFEAASSRHAHGPAPPQQHRGPPSQEYGHHAAAPPGAREHYGPPPPGATPQQGGLPPPPGATAGYPTGNYAPRPLAAPPSLRDRERGDGPPIGASPPRHAGAHDGGPPRGAPHPAHHHQQAGGPGPGPTPLTARFVPQTAKLPSPAYHTTRFVQSTAGGQPAGGPGPTTVSGHEARSGPPGGVAPRTAGLPPSSYPTATGPPPQTARPILPPSSDGPLAGKQQFLSLFSSFYDSLSDSRTLKATLEDQVRRSNTLLQTLQRSSRVLEATVERKVREERGWWEERWRGLEERVGRLEGSSGSGVRAELRGEGGEEDEVMREGEREDAAAGGLEERIELLEKKKSSEDADASVVEKTEEQEEPAAPSAAASVAEDAPSEAHDGDEDDEEEDDGNESKETTETATAAAEAASTADTAATATTAGGKGKGGSKAGGARRKKK